MLCEHCHKEKYGTTLAASHCVRVKAKCERCKKVETSAECHCYLRTEHMYAPAPIRGKVSK